MFNYSANVIAVMQNYMLTFSCYSTSSALMYAYIDDTMCIDRLT